MMDSRHGKLIAVFVSPCYCSTNLYRHRYWQGHPGGSPPFGLAISVFYADDYDISKPYLPAKLI